MIEKIALVLDVDLKTLIYPEATDEPKLPRLDTEWVKLINELKESGSEKERIREFKKFLEFIKWQNEQNHENNRQKAKKYTLKKLK